MDKNIKHTLIGLGAGLLIGYSLNQYMNSEKNENLDHDMLKKKKPQKKKEETKNVENKYLKYKSAEYKNMLKEQLVRNIQFFGEENQEKINNSYVIIFGVGGVGSHAAASLARSGVGRIKIIDFDQISLSSLNLHAFATQSDVGRSKVECIRDYIHRIVPSTHVDTVEDLVTKDNIESFFQDFADDGKTILEPSYVVDCIEDMDAKVALLAYCKLNNKKVISSMGAGMKADPTRIQIRDISETNNDEKSRIIRQKLKKYKVYDGIKVVLSVERNDKVFLQQKHDKENNLNKQNVNSLQIVPVLGTMPALVAYSLSSYILCDLAGQLYKPSLIEEVKQASYAKLFNHLYQEARKIGITYEALQFDVEDVYIQAREIYDWKDVINDKKVCGGLLVRWNPEKSFEPSNFVLLNFEDSKKHSNYKAFSEVQAAYSKDILAKVEEKQKQYQQFIQNNPNIFK